MWNSTGATAPPDEFFEVARHVYKDDPLWPVESEETIRGEFSEHNPYAEASTWQPGAMRTKRASLDSIILP